MRYAIANLGQAAPARFVPVLTDCSNVDEFHKAVKNASDRIAFYNARLQEAAAAENYGGVDAAKIEVDQASRDWETWKKAIEKCEGVVVESPAPAASASQRDWILLGVGAIAIGVGAFWVASKTKLSDKLLSVFKTG